MIMRKPQKHGIEDMNLNNIEGGIMKDHEIAELVNKLTAISREFHDHQSLRARISRTIVPAISPHADGDYSYMCGNEYCRCSS